MAEDELFDGDMAMDSIESNAVEDMEKDNYSDPNAGTVVNFVKSHYSRASTYRETEERRWIQAYRNYRGLYGPDVQFTSTEKSRIFVKVTKTKVLAAYGQIVDVLFGNNKFPITVDPTTLPEGVVESVFQALAKGKREVTHPSGIAAGYVVKALAPEFLRNQVLKATKK